MNKRKKLPIGIESFEEMRKEDFYYVDKTRWIEQVEKTLGSRRFLLGRHSVCCGWHASTVASDT